jgi:hypothetical protein
MGSNGFETCHMNRREVLVECFFLQNYSVNQELVSFYQIL